MQRLERSSNGGRRAPIGRPIPVVVVAALVLVLTGCQPWSWTVDGIPTGGAAAPREAILTPDGSDRYELRATAEGLRVAAPTENAGGNLRMLFWPPESPVLADSTSCATWSAQGGRNVQQGAALRIRVSPGRVRAITVTKNVYFGAAWGFNFHTWDTDRDRPAVQFGGVEIHNLRVGTRVKPFPWHFCARIRDRSVEFKVWLDGQPEPTWGDPEWGGSRLLPEGWGAPGATGWYIGHLPPGGSADFEHLTTQRWSGAPRLEGVSPVPGQPAPQEP